MYKKYEDFYELIRYKGIKGKVNKEQKGIDFLK